MGEDSPSIHPSIHHQSVGQIQSLVPDNLSLSFWMSPTLCVTLSLEYISFIFHYSAFRYQINTTIQNSQLAAHVKMNSVPWFLSTPTKFNLLWGRATVNEDALPGRSCNPVKAAQASRMHCAKFSTAVSNQ